MVGPERGREGGSLLLGKMGQGFIERLTFPVGLPWMVGAFTEKQAWRAGEGMTGIKEEQRSWGA